MEIDEFSILTDDLIDYSSLSEDPLKELALGEELFIATSALAQLATIKSALAVAVAADILSHLRGDRYLHAAAIETLFGIDKMRAIEYMKQAVTGEGDRYILTAIVELAIENQSDFQSGLGWTVFRLLSDKIKSFKIYSPTCKISQKVKNQTQTHKIFDLGLSLASSLDNLREYSDN